MISEHKERFGVEPICTVLSQHGCPIAPSTYYDNLARAPSRRQLRDEQLKQVISAERETSKFVRLLGARKMWLRLRRAGYDVARCTVEQLMRELGVTGAQRGGKPRTTVADDTAARPADLVDRDFTATAPNQLWCADFTYVPTWAGMVYVAFVFDVFSRRILGWQAAVSMATDLVLDTLDMARIHGHLKVDAVFHSDRGSQGGFNRWSQHLDRGGVRWDAGSGRRWRRLRVLGGSGQRIGLCGRRCAHRVGLSPLVQCSESSGV
ncbi:MAG: IS3 family transposase [Streptosporangiales bacterium]